VKATKQIRNYPPHIKCLCSRQAVAYRCGGAVCAICYAIEDAMKRLESDRISKGFSFRKQLLQFDESKKERPRLQMEEEKIK
jgi:hypothetical protein